ncbi:MAG: hypothetical protein ACOCZK_01475 [Planctomycetota bacterium]
MSEQNQELPDIDAGLDQMAKETTAAELLKQKGQRAKLKVMKERDLKGFINRALTEIMSGRSDQLDEEERQRIIAESEAKVADLLEKVRRAEAERQASEQQRLAEEQQAAALRERIEALTNQVTEEESASAASEELKQAVAEQQAQVVALTTERDRLQEEVTTAQADVMVIEEDLNNTRNILQTTIEERDKANAINRDLMIHATELVQNVLDLDNTYYNQKHQTENPTDEEADAHAAFFHDFAIGTQVVKTLASDLETLASLRQAPEEPEAEAESPMLSQQLQQLVDQIQSGSLSAVDTAEPLAALCEALGGARERTDAVQRELAGEEGNTVPLTAVPESEGDPGAVLAGSAQVIRQMDAALAAVQARLAEVTQGGKEQERLEDTIRRHMLRSTDLIQGVLGLDNEHYAGRHQEQDPADEDAGAQEAFFHDFEVGAQVIETLRQDLDRLTEMQREKEERAGAPLIEDEHQRTLFEQLTAGSLSAVDVAEPVANLAEAMTGAREEVVALQQAVEGTGVAGGDEHVPVSAVPDADGDPQEVIAGTIKVVRELAAALARERSRVAALQGGAGESEKLEQTMREQMLRSTDLVQGILGLDDRFYEGSHQQQNPADEDANVQEGFFHDFAVCTEVVGDIATDLERLRDLSAELSDKEAGAADRAEAAKTAGAQAAEPQDTGLDAAVAALRSLRGERDRLRTEHEQLSAQHDQLVAEKDGLAIERDQLAEERGGLIGERDELAAEKDGLVIERDQVLAERDRLSGELEQLRKEVGELAGECDRLKADVGSDDEELRDLAETLVVLTRDDDELAAAPEHQVLAESLGQDGGAPTAADAGEAEKDQAGEASGPGDLLRGARSVIDSLGTRNQALRAQVRQLREQLAQTSGNEAEQARELAGALLAVSKRDAELGETPACRELAGDLEPGSGMSTDAEGTGGEDMARILEHARAVIEALGSRNQTLRDRLAVVDGAVAEAGAQARQHEQALSELHEELTAARERMAEMRVENERLETKAEELEVARKRIRELEQRIETAESEKAEAMEVVLSGKEVIALLNDKEQKVTRERDELARRAEGLEARLNQIQTRMEKAESAATGLGESLSEVVQAIAQQSPDLDELPDLESSRVEMEVALSELPGDDQQDVPVREDISDDLLAAGTGIVEALGERSLALAKGLKQARDQLAQAQEEQVQQVESLAAQKQEAEARVAELEKAEARLASVKQENEELSGLLASKNADLSTARDELAGLRVDLKDAQARGEQQRQQLEQLEAKAQRLAALEQESAQAQSEAATVRAAQKELCEAIAGLAEDTAVSLREFKLAGKKETQRFSRTYEKFEEGVEKANGGGSLLETGRLLVEQLQIHTGALGDQLRTMTEEEKRLSHMNHELQERLAGIEAGIADRDMRITDLQQQVEELGSERERVAQEREQWEQERRERKRALAQARAELEELRARQSERSQGGDSHAAELARELEAARSATEQVEVDKARIEEEMNAKVAGLQRRLDELARSLESRDAQIAEMQSAIDGAGVGQVQIDSLQDEVDRLRNELASERERMRELESQAGAGEPGARTLERLQQEIRSAQEQRDAHLIRLRQLETEVAEERGRLQEVEAARDALRKDMAARSETLRKEIAQMRERAETAEAEKREMREELAGLRARVKALSEE